MTTKKIVILNERSEVKDLGLLAEIPPYASLRAGAHCHPDERSEEGSRHNKRLAIKDNLAEILHFVQNDTSVGIAICGHPDIKLYRCLSAFICD